MKNGRMAVSKIVAKEIDYKRFGFSLLFVGVFFYLGSVIPKEGKTMLDTYAMMGTTCLMLVVSAIFFSLSIKYKKLRSEIKEDDSI
ncbi:hypothetical protein D0469_00595 [Peribacillus saganii]|uniref:YrhC-like protein n=1 Tax=Peribacillus saganii TaxID=2303992 RepID=A0A372LV18_9BACI|nr:YrhC family protein [Peribacillus saganii]RFU71640.1 hypothetical protein D0469_00595 [Peribacillus saganii]